VGVGSQGVGSGVLVGVLAGTGVGLVVSVGVSIAPGVLVGAFVLAGSGVALVLVGCPSSGVLVGSFALTPQEQVSILSSFSLIAFSSARMSNGDVSANTTEPINIKTRQITPMNPAILFILLLIQRTLTEVQNSL
jgi:hypothetical protein